MSSEATEEKEEEEYHSIIKDTERSKGEWSSILYVPKLNRAGLEISENRHSLCITKIIGI